MVVICDQPYTNSDIKYNEQFDKFKFPLSDFQKYAIQAIMDGHHSLVTAHTGSGKTLPAEFAIEYFTQQGKKVVYTSPIKALSNQKYYDFTRKFPHLSIGLFTGDIKMNPSAQVLIMTTEILMNHLFSLQNGNENPIQDDFSLNVQEELACVVFDEVHYINDAHRGQNWEQTILMLPEHVQMVMLSATIDQPEKFAEWCEKEGSSKQVHLSYTYQRVVPLTHYGFLTTNEGIYKKIKDKATQQKIRDQTNKFVVLKTSNDKFVGDGYLQLKSMDQLFEKNDAFINKNHVLNQLVGQLKEEEMLPAIAFVFSRKMVESYAKAIHTNILEFDSKIPYTMKNECDQLLRKLPNYKEYIHLPEYDDLVLLLEKGIGIHHSGMIPVLREIVETMISRGCVKLLFATESFAIGLDCPIRTAIFTSLTKFDGTKMRYLLSHEYSQAAGRAGRRGLDTVGHVVHCNNMFELPSENEYKEILCGAPQTLISKFYISFSTILSLMKNEKYKLTDFIDFVQKSMLQTELTKAVTKETTVNRKLQEELSAKEITLSMMKTPVEICQQYLILNDQGPDDPFIKKKSNKQRKNDERMMESLRVEHKFLLQDVDKVKEFRRIRSELTTSTQYIQTCDAFIHTKTQAMCALLENCGFIICEETESETENNETNIYKFTHKGKCASMMAEVHSLVTMDFLEKHDYLSEFSVQHIVGLLSVYSDIKVGNDFKSSVPKTDDGYMKSCIKDLLDIYESYARAEHEYDINSGYSYDEPISLELIDALMEWSTLENEQECKYFVQTQLAPLEVGLGDFTKGVLKMSAVAKEWYKMATFANQVDFQYKLSQVDEKILKFIVTTQSLYT